MMIRNINIGDGDVRFHEIEFLSNLAQPDIAVITNIGESHMQDLGSRGLLKLNLKLQ